MIRVPGWLLLTALLAMGGMPCEAIEAGAPAPAFELAATDGQTHSLASLIDGNALLLDFGSVFCMPCREVLEGLVELQRAYAGQGLRVAAVNVDGPKYLTAVNSVCDGLGATYPVLLDADGTVAEAYGVEAIPYLVLVDGAGTVRAVHLGRSPDPAADLGLDALLAEQETKQ